MQQIFFLMIPFADMYRIQRHCFHRTSSEYVCSLESRS